MQRTQVKNAGHPDVSAPRDDGAAMAAALRRLATLRATIYRDWSDGPSSLVAFANTDLPAEADTAPTRAYTLDAPALSFTLDPTFVLEAPAPERLELRGRFECLDDMPPPAMPAEEEVTDELHIGAGAGADVAYLLDLVRSLPKAPTVLVRPASAETPKDLDEVEVLAVGAFADLAPLIVAPEPATAATRTDAAAADNSEVDVSLAVGAVAGFVAWIEAPVQRAPTPRAEIVSESVVEEEVLVLGAGAFAGIAVWLDAPVVEAEDAPAVAAAPDEIVEDDVFAIGAVSDCLALDAPPIPVPAPIVNAEPADLEETVADDAVGAVAGLARLLELAPEPTVFTPPPVIDLEEVAFDDFLADAVEALYVAALDPTEHYAWGASVLPADNGNAAAHLAACESAFWNLPRVVPCGEAFTLQPNHEIAVKITRALRVRADTLRARAFTETFGFGVLHSHALHLPWFPSVERPRDAGSDTIDADTQFAALDMDDPATLISAPERPRPILSEDELDALLATPAARDSHELEDDWQENPVWRETFWHDVDAYLQTVETTDVEEAPKTIAETFATHDIEIRDDPPPAAMHFWSPGDEADLAICGDGDDLFLVGGGEAGVVLVEDGAIHSMRTGRGTRMGEVVVSWSADPWTDVDAMTWTRVATLSGVSQVRVEQTITHDRAVVVAGDLSSAGMRGDRVHLVEATENGPREFPVRRIGGLDHGAEWPFADLGGKGEDHRLLV